MAGSGSDIDSPGDITNRGRRGNRKTRKEKRYAVDETGKEKRPLQKTRIIVLALIAIGALLTIVFPDRPKVITPPIKFPIQPTPTVIATNTTLIYPPGRNIIILPTPAGGSGGQGKTPGPPQGSPSPKPSPSPSQPPGFLCRAFPGICNQGGD